jgi:hypothetical protein
MPSSRPDDVSVAHEQNLAPENLDPEEVLVLLR